MNTTDNQARSFEKTQLTQAIESTNGTVEDTVTAYSGIYAEILNSHEDLKNADPYFEELQARLQNKIDNSEPISIASILASDNSDVIMEEPEHDFMFADIISPNAMMNFTDQMAIGIEMWKETANNNHYAVAA